MSPPHQRHNIRLTEVAVTVVSADPETGKVIVRDSVSNEFEIDHRLRPKGMGWPDPGERWLLTRRGTTWVFDSQIGAPDIIRIDGSRDGMHPVAVQMLEAMARHGLILDGTTGAVIPVFYDETNDPVVDDPDDEQWEDGGDEGVPEPPDIPRDPRDPKPPKDEDPPKDKNDDKRPPSEVHSDLFSIISYNCWSGLGAIRAREDLRRIWQQADIVGLQECYGAQRGQVLESAPGNWGLFRPPTGPEPPIMWREGVFDYITGDHAQLSPYDGSGSARPARVVNWVRLRHKGTGDQIVVVNFHWENAAAFRGYFDRSSRPSANRHVERYREQMPQMLTLMRSLSRYGPIILTGDFNVNFRQDLKLRNPGLPTASFHNIGMRSNWDLNGLPSIGTHGGVHGSVFDAVCLKNKVPGQIQFLGSVVLRGYQSDHRPVRVRARIRNIKNTGRKG